MYQILQNLLNKNSRHDSHKFTIIEAKNMIFYILGIMCYKFALETFLGSISILAADRFKKQNAFTLLGLLQGLNQSAQCIGSILVAPLITKYATNKVLAIAIWSMMIMGLVLLITEASTGGTINSNGNWNIFGLFPIFILSGISHGMVELIRRIIPRDICGGLDFKLRKMDSMVHIFYEVSGTLGAFLSAFLILQMGPVYANFHVPFLLLAAGLCWYKIQLIDSKENISNSSTKIKESTSLLYNFWFVFKGFFISVYQGATIIFSSRKFSWLILGYSLPLVLHRYLESQLLPAFSKTILNQTAYSQIMVGGSNFGELLGALFVFLFTYSVPTPLPWLRLDAITLNILWVLPYSYPTNNFGFAWLIALLLVFVSFGWASGDVSLSAYIQASLSHSVQKSSVSPLGAVMAFLYSTYIVIYACLSYGLGMIFDQFLLSGNPREGLFYIAGVMMTIASFIIFLASFIPPGSFKLNPSYEDLGIIEQNDHDEEVPEEKDSKMEQNNNSNELVNIVNNIGI